MSENISLLSSVDGKITTIGMAINLTQPAVEFSYGEFWGAFREEIVFVVMISYPKHAADNFEEKVRASWENVWQSLGRDSSRHQIFFQASEDENFGRWIHDYFLVAETLAGIDYGNSFLFLPNFLNKDAPIVGHAFARQLRWEVQHGQVNLEGGNVLAYDDRAWVGKDVVCPTHECLDAGKFHARLLAELHVREVIVVGTAHPTQFLPNLEPSFQPFYHLDIFLTFAGKLVDGRSCVLIAELQDRYVSGPVSTVNVYLTRIRDGLAEIVTQFLNKGFVVRRLPIALHFSSATSYRVYSYNNCLVEVCGDHKVVHLPSYTGSLQHAGLEDVLSFTNCLAKQIFEEMGFDVQQVGGLVVEQAARSRGGINCLTRVIGRDAQ